MKINLTNNDIHKIIDDAMEKRDRTVSIFIMNESVSVNVKPVGEDDGMKWIEIHKDLAAYKCSECGGHSECADLYCRHCGAQRTGIIRVIDAETQSPEIVLYRKGEDHDQN